MSRHLTDDQLATLARPDGAPASSDHLGACPSCRLRLEGWSGVALALREADGPDLAPPAFDALLGGLLAPSGTARRAPTPPAPGGVRDADAADRVPRPRDRAGAGPRRSWSGALRLAGSLVLAQGRLVPRSLPWIALVGFVLATLVAGAVPDDAAAAHVFGAGVSLVLILLGLATCSRRTDPSAEYLRTLPITPATAFAARLTLTLGAGVALALVATATLAAGGAGPGLATLVAAWMGSGLLASGVAVVVAVRWSSGTGAVAGLVLWLAGTATGAPDSRLADGAGAPLAALWESLPTALVLGLALLALATVVVHRGRTIGASS